MLAAPVYSKELAVRLVVLCHSDVSGSEEQDSMQRMVLLIK